jgi:hypothetical protein
MYFWTSKNSLEFKLYEEEDRGKGDREKGGGRKDKGDGRKDKGTQVAINNEVET